MANHSKLGIVDLHHTAIGEEGLVREGLPRRPHRGHPKTRLLPCAHPLVGGEFLERLFQLRVQEDARQEPVGLHGHPIGIVPVRRVEPDR